MISNRLSKLYFVQITKYAAINIRRVSKVKGEKEKMQIRIKISYTEKVKMKMSKGDKRVERKNED